MINIIFSISFYIAIGFIFYILLKRRAFFSLSVLGLYSLYHLFIFIMVAFDESFFWGFFATVISLLSWSWLFLLFFVPALFFDFWKAKRVAIQDSQPKSNQRQGAYLMIIIFLILISIGGVFYFFSKREENISIKNKKNEESSQFSGKNIIKDFGDTGVIVISPEHNQTIFTSKELGISLKYPKEWGVMEEKIKGRPLSGDLAFGFSWKNANTGYDYDPDIYFGIVGGVFPAWEFLPPLLIDYKGEPVDDACQKNAYLDSSPEKIKLPTAEKIHTINLKDCKIIKISNKLPIAVFGGTYASNYRVVDEPYYDIAIIVPEQRTFYNFKGAIMQTQSQKYPGFKIWIDERFLRNNTDFKEQEKIFDNIINSLLLIQLNNI